MKGWGLGEGGSAYAAIVFVMVYVWLLLTMMTLI